MFVSVFCSILLLLPITYPFPFSLPSLTHFSTLHIPPLPSTHPSKLHLSFPFSPFTYASLYSASLIPVSLLPLNYGTHPSSLDPYLIFFYPLPLLSFVAVADHVIFYTFVGVNFPFSCSCSCCCFIFSFVIVFVQFLVFLFHFILRVIVHFVRFVSVLVAASVLDIVSSYTLNLLYLPLLSLLFFLSSYFSSFSCIPRLSFPRKLSICLRQQQRFHQNN